MRCPGVPLHPYVLLLFVSILYIEFLSHFIILMKKPFPFRKTKLVARRGRINGVEEEGVMMVGLG